MDQRTARLPLQLRQTNKYWGRPWRTYETKFKLNNSTRSLLYHHWLIGSSSRRQEVTLQNSCMFLFPPYKIFPPHSPDNRLPNATRIHARTLARYPLPVFYSLTHHTLDTNNCLCQEQEHLDTMLGIGSLEKSLAFPCFPPVRPTDPHEFDSLIVPAEDVSLLDIEDVISDEGTGGRKETVRSNARHGNVPLFTSLTSSSFLLFMLSFALLSILLSRTCHIRCNTQDEQDTPDPPDMPNNHNTSIKARHTPERPHAPTPTNTLTCLHTHTITPILSRTHRQTSHMWKSKYLPRKLCRHLHILSPSPDTPPLPVVS